MNALSPNLEMARRFLRALDPSTNRFTFVTRPDRDGDPSLTRVLHGTLDELADTLTDLNRRGAAISVAMNRTDFAGVKRRNIVSVRALFADFDHFGRTPGAGALPPSIVVRTGNGRHVFWALESGQSTKRWRKVERALAKRLNADTGAITITQSPRLPGFYHCKGDPTLVVIEQIHPDRRYTLERAVETWNLAPLMKPKKKSPPRTPDADSPFDDYNIRGDWTVLERHGWEVVRRDGQTTHWRRPGKRRKQTSATTDAEGKVGLFWCFSSKAPPFDPDRGYTRSQVYASLEHAGNYREAAEALLSQGYGRRRADTFRDKLREHEAALWDQALAEGPPPEAERRSRPRRHEPTPPPEFNEDFEIMMEPVSEPIAISDGPPPGFNEDFEVRTDPPKSKGKKGKKGKKKSVYGVPPNSGDPQDGTINFRVSKVVKWMNDPPVYDVYIENRPQVLTVTLEEFTSRRLFRRKFFSVYDYLPALPEGEEFDLLVNYWMKNHEEIDQPIEGSEWGNLLSELRDCLRSLRPGIGEIDLEHGHRLPHPSKDGWYIVKVTTLRRHISDEMGRPMNADMVSRAATTLGCEFDRPRCVETYPDGSTHVFRPRVWRFKPELDEDDYLTPSPAEHPHLH